MEIPILFLRLRPAADSVLSVLDSHPQFEFEKVQQSSFSAFIFFMKTVRHCFSVRRCFINFLNDGFYLRPCVPLKTEGKLLRFLLSIIEGFRFLLVPL